MAANIILVFCFLFLFYLIGIAFGIFGPYLGNRSDDHYYGYELDPDSQQHSLGDPGNSNGTGGNGTGNTSGTGDTSGSGSANGTKSTSNTRSTSGTRRKGTGTVLDEYRSQATPGMTSQILDMENTGTRYDLNLFLSNFTEKNSVFTFDWETCTDKEMCLFAADHTRLNYPEAVEVVSGSKIRNASGEVCNERIPYDIFAKYPRVFLKKDFDASNVVDPFVIDGGYVYFPPDGWHVPNGVAFVTSTTEIGENRVLVTFDVYGDGVDYVVTDESYYTCSSGELMRKLGVSGISRTGYAVVEPVDDGSVAPFKLWGFESE